MDSNVCRGNNLTCETLGSVRYLGINFGDVEAKYDVFSWKCKYKRRRHKLECGCNGMLMLLQQSVQN